MASKVHRRRHPDRQFDIEGLEAIRLAFAHKFGRLPGGDDPVFFDPAADKPHSLPVRATQRLLLEAMLETGTSPQIVYAFCRTGFAVTQEERSTLAPERLALWDTAVNEYLSYGHRPNSLQH